MTSDDLHGIAVVRNGSRIVYATTNKGLHVSRDGGVSWTIYAASIFSYRRLGFEHVGTWHRQKQNPVTEGCVRRRAPSESEAAGERPPPLPEGFDDLRCD